MGATTQISDIIVPEIFTGYVQQRTQEKSRLIASGAILRSPQLDQDLAGGGITFNAPSMQDLKNDEDNVSTDAPDDSFTGGSANSTPKSTKASLETCVRLSRNQSWSSADLTAALAGTDPVDSIVERVSDYWARRLQAAFVATVRGVFANNDSAPLGSEHIKGDLSNDISGVTFDASLTAFSANAFIDATVTMGDSMGDLTMVAVHSIVYARMQKNNLITYIPDSRGEVVIPTFLGRIVIVDDGVPHENGVFQTWLFGAGAYLLGMGSPKVPTAVARKEDSGNGGGSEILYNRHEWAIHPVGHRYMAPVSQGGPTNHATAGNLAHAESWQRVYPERKQIKIARLITREY